MAKRGTTGKAARLPVQQLPQKITVSPPSEAAEPLGLSHLPLSRLSWNADDGWMLQSRVLLVRSQQATTALVFVHGWRGNANDTWEAFPRAIRFMPETQRSDAFFIHYPTTEQTISFHAAKLRKLFTDLVRTPSESIVNPSLPRTEARRDAAATYDRIVVIAHSMGAVVSRRALLDLERDDQLTDAQLQRIRLLFFAPAHKGSSIAGLIEAGFGLDWLPGATAVSKMLTLYYRSLQDLADSSESLRNLAVHAAEVREGRTRAKKRYDHLRAIVYHAENDKVVSQEPFDADYPIEPIMRKNHRNVCKPDNEYRTPVLALEAALRTVIV